MNTSARSALIGGAVMVAIATSLALGRGPVPHQMRDKPFNDALHEDIGTLAMMSEQIEAMNKPRLVQTESVKPIEPDPLIAVLSTEPAPQPIRRKAESDICTKHGMHKVMVDKHRWRCRK